MNTNELINTLENISREVREKRSKSRLELDEALKKYKIDSNNCIRYEMDHKKTNIERKIIAILKELGCLQTNTSTFAIPTGEKTDKGVEVVCEIKLTHTTCPNTSITCNQRINCSTIEGANKIYRAKQSYIALPHSVDKTIDKLICQLDKLNS